MAGHWLYLKKETWVNPGLNHERAEIRTPNQWLKRQNQSLKRAENPFVRGIFRDKLANFHVHCVHTLQGFHANCTQIAPNNELGKTNLYFNEL
jgi:hypothetical protein